MKNKTRANLIRSFLLFLSGVGLVLVTGHQVEESSKTRPPPKRAPKISVGEADRMLFRILRRTKSGADLKPDVFISRYAAASKPEAEPVPAIAQNPTEEAGEETE